MQQNSVIIIGVEHTAPVIRQKSEEDKNRWQAVVNEIC